jgi:hypothetical protein
LEERFRERQRRIFDNAGTVRPMTLKFNLIDQINKYIRDNGRINTVSEQVMFSNGIEQFNTGLRIKEMDIFRD